ncbi:MAG: LysR family transcriptional regulator [Thiolinea sp.]
MSIASQPRVDRITLKQLRSFTAYIREGTIKGAALRLNISPPAISQQLSLLEENVGAPLTVKKTDGTETTAFGQEVLLTASHIENQLNHCQTALGKLNDIDCGKVAIGIFNSASYFAPRLIAEFKKSHPQAEVRICIGNRENVFQAFRHYEYDFLVVGRPPQEETMESFEIGDHPHIVIGAPNHPLIQRKNLQFKDLKDESFLVREQGSGTRLVMMRLFEEAGVSLQPGMEIGNNESVKQAVISGLGIALISAHTVAAELQEGRLKAFDIQGLPIIRKWLVVKHRTIPLTPTAQALFDFFIESGSHFFPATETLSC